MAAFPWTTLITVAGTLGGALGGVGLKARYDSQDRRFQAQQRTAAASDDRRRESYASLLVSARELHANLQQMRVFYSSDMHDPTVAALNKRMDSRSDQVSQAAASVDLLGSDHVRAAEIELADAAQVFTTFRLSAHDDTWSLDTPDGYDEVHIEAAERRLQSAISAFADAARAEVSGTVAAAASQVTRGTP